MILTARCPVKGTWTEPLSYTTLKNRPITKTQRPTQKDWSSIAKANYAALKGKQWMHAVPATLKGRPGQ